MIRVAVYIPVYGYTGPGVVSDDAARRPSTALSQMSLSISYTDAERGDAGDASGVGDAGDDDDRRPSEMTLVALRQFFAVHPRFSPTYYTTDQSYLSDFAASMPHVIVTLVAADAIERAGGAMAWTRAFPHLARAPPPIHTRRLSIHSPGAMSVRMLLDRHFACITNVIGRDRFDARRMLSTPLVSVFTTSFRSGAKIMRPYTSLLAQTYTHWEWVVVCDTPDADDGDANFNMLRALAKTDYRIRVIKPAQNEGTGMIGAGKYHAAMACSGNALALVELDHDDELMPACLEKVARAFMDNPDVVFLSTCFSEPHEDAPRTNFARYVPGWGHGYGAHYFQGDLNTTPPPPSTPERAFPPRRPSQVHTRHWALVSRSGPLNPVTIRALAAAPNHARVWRASTYRAIGGHNARLKAADDMDVMIRTLVSNLGTFAILPEHLYRQYRNAKQNNFTTIYGVEIQWLVTKLRKHYSSVLQAHFALHGIDDRFSADTDAWSARDTHTPRWMVRNALCMAPLRMDRVVGLAQNTITLILTTNHPSTTSGSILAAIRAIQAQSYPHWILYIVGHDCPLLEKTMHTSTYKAVLQSDSRIRWWNILPYSPPPPPTRERSVVQAPPLRDESLCVDCCAQCISKNYILALLCDTRLVGYLDAGAYISPIPATLVATYIDACCKTPTVAALVSSLGSPVFFLHRHSLLERYTGLWSCKVHPDFPMDVTHTVNTAQLILVDEWRRQGECIVCV